MYHNRHFTQDQLNTLANRGQPAEIQRLKSSHACGYCPPQQVKAPEPTSLNAADERHYKACLKTEETRRSAIISGVLACETNVVDTGVRDRFGRPINRVVHSDVPTSELVFDPQSTKDDYSDAMFLHRFKWVHESVVAKVFGKDKLAKDRVL